MRLLVLLCILGLAVAAPPEPRTAKDIEDYRIFLEKARPDSGDLLEDAMARNPLASPWENSGKYQGDIILNDEMVNSMVAEYSGQRNALQWRYWRWPQNTVIWDFAPGHFDANQQQQILNSFNFFNTRTCVRFRRRTNQRDYVWITGHQDGCYATPGFWPNGGRHIFNLARGCFHPMIIIHEWLHTIGFMHMHQTYTRDNYVVVHRENMIRGTERNFDRLTNQQVNMLGLPYEYASNQHYGSHAFSANGRPTLVARRAGGNQMGQLQFISGWDTHRVNRLYSCPGAWSEEVHLEDANKPAYTMEDVEAFEASQMLNPVETADEVETVDEIEAVDEIQAFDEN